LLEEREDDEVGRLSLIRAVRDEEDHVNLPIPTVSQELLGMVGTQTIQNSTMVPS
jgi:hypothetical protein